MTLAIYLCIGCPLGCRLEVEEDAAGAVVAVRGFSCKRGHEYAEQEHRAPQRIVTTTVAVTHTLWPRLPVRSDRPVPKGMVRAVCARLHNLEVAAPVQMGQVILADVLGTGANIVAARDMPAAP